MSYNVEVVCALLEYGANTELRGSKGDSDGTALCLAVREKQSEIVHALLTAGADVASAARKGGRKPLLIMACAWGDTSVVRALLDTGADMEVRGDTWYETSEVSALHAAIHARHLDVVKMLLARGFDLNSTFGRAFTPLELAVKVENREALDAILDSLPHDSLKILTKGIRRAIYECKVLLVEQFLDHPRTALSTDTVLDLALYACRMPSCEIVELLLDSICRRSDISLESTLAEIDFQKGWVPEGNFETLFRYTPCTANIFVQACICGSLSGVQQGLRQGNSPHVEDSYGRPAFHFAAVHGRADVVKLLLDNGASATHMHTTYGTPLSITLEAWSAYLLHKQPHDRGTHPSEKIRSHIQNLTGLETSKYSDDFLDDEEFDMSYYYSRSPVPRIDFQQARCVEYMSIVELLMQNSTDSYGSAGRGRVTLALAAFLGVDEILDELLNCGISLTTSSEALSSIFLAAIVGKQAGSVAKVAGIASISVLDPGNRALHLACEGCDLTLIRLLHTYGYHYNTRNGTGETALNHCLVAFGHKYERKSRSHTFTSAERAVIQYLLEAEPAATVYVEDMTAAIHIQDDKSREDILSILVSNSQNTYCSSDDFARLMIMHGGGVISSSDAAWQLLQRKCLPALTNEILAVAHDIETVRALLNYDLSYAVDSSSLDDLGRYWDEVHAARSDSYLRRRYDGRQFDGHRRNAMGLLFHRGNDVLPSEENVVKAMAVIGDPRRCRLSDVSKMQSESQNLIDSMFKRNANLTVTEEMLTIVRDPSDLRALLAHTIPGSQVVTASVLGALITPRPNDNCEALFNDRTRSREEAEKLLRVFLEFDPDVSVPPEVSQHFMDIEQIHDPSTLDVLLRHNPELQLSLEYILSAIEYRPRAKHTPKDFIQVLRNYKDRWECTAEMEKAIAESERQQAGRESRWK